MKKCDVCGNRGWFLRSFTRPEAEREEHGMHETFMVCSQCDHAILWTVRRMSMQYAEDNKQYKGVTNAEINALLNDDYFGNKGRSGNMEGSE